MRKSFVVLIYALTGLALAGSLTGCVVAPAQPAYYGYDSGYYAPGYYGYGYRHRPHVCAVWRHDRWGHAYRTTAWC